MEKRRKQTRGRTGLLAAGVLAASLLAGAPFPAAAAVEAGMGSLTVTLEEFGAPSVREGVRISLSRVGDAGVHEEPQFYEEYRIGSYPVNSRETESVIRKLLEAGAMDEPLVSALTDAEGTARFTGLSDGIYLGAAEDAARYGEISPFLIHTPSYGEGDGPSYAVAVHPKALPVKDLTPTTKPTGTPKPTGIPERTPASGPGSPGGGGSPAGGGNSPKTGDESQAGVLLCLLCVSAAVIVMVSSRRKKV